MYRGGIIIDLTMRLDDFIMLGADKIPINLSFDSVLNAYKALEDKEPAYANKVFRALNAFGVSGSYTIAERAFLLESIFAKIEELAKSIDQYNFPTGGSGGKPIDYEKDTSLIYAAFRQAYGIDLFEMQGKLHWIKFLMLLNNLPEDTKLSKVIGYRTTVMPPRNKHNKAEVDHAIKMKNVYRLEESPEKVNEQINSALAMMFSSRPK